MISFASDTYMSVATSGIRTSVARIKVVANFPILECDPLAAMRIQGIAGFSLSTG